MKWVRERLSYDDDGGKPTHRWKFVPWWFADLVACPWCVSAYISAIVTWLTDLTIDKGLPVPVLFALAAWATATWPILWEDSKT